MVATVQQRDRKMDLVTAFWWEGTGENRKRIKGRERPDGNWIEPKNHMSWTCILAVETEGNGKNNNTNKKNKLAFIMYSAYIISNRMYLRWIVLKKRKEMFTVRLTDSNKRGKHAPTLMVIRAAMLEASFLLVSTKREIFELYH